MATHDYVIANGTGAAVRSDINGALAAIVSQNSNASAPATTYAYMSWADTTAGVMKMRNGANSAWISLYELDGTFLASDISLAAGSAAAPSLFFTGDTNTGIYSPGADQVAISTGGTGRLFVQSDGDVCIGQSTGDSQLVVKGSTAARTVSQFIANDTSTTTLAVWERSDGAVSSRLIYDGGGLIKFGTSTSHALAFDTSNTERARIDSSGRLLVGTSSARTSGLGSGISFLVEGAPDTINIGTVRNSNNASSAKLVLAKTRGSAVGSNTAVQSDDSLGVLEFDGADGTQLLCGASIEALVDGTPGANDMPGRLVFSTTADGAASPTERMRIGSNGFSNLFVTAADGFQSRNSSAAGTSSALFAGRHTATSTTNGTLSFIVWTNGDVVNTNNSYGAISDLKLKENIVDANSQWDDLKALQVRNYNFKEGQTHTQIGLVAQEAELVSPGLVNESPDRDEEGNDLGTVTKSVNYSVLYMKAVKALQEAMERIEALETRLSALEAA